MFDLDVRGMPMEESTIDTQAIARREQVLVVGGGPCGLALARQLGRELGHKPLVVDRGDAPAASWRARYDGFRLNTCGYWSHLPGQRLPAGAGRWPDRQAMIDYFDDYVARQGIRLRLGVEAIRIQPCEQGWAVHTNHGTYLATAVVVATGNYRVPILPPWPGMDAFSGRIVHSADYRNAEPFRGEEVMVVGSGNSAADIAVQLADGGAERVMLAVRTPPHLVRRSTLGIPADAFALLTNRAPVAFVDRAAAALRAVTFGDLSLYGFGLPPQGIYTTVRETGRIPTLADVLVDRVRRGKVELTAAVDGFDSDKVLLDGGDMISLDTVIAATGFRAGLEPMVGHLDVLRPDGHPVSNGAIPAAAGLWFAGFAEPFTGPLRSFRLQAAPLARTIADYVVTRK
jgi:putative flavoprotein involved in K+ transport